MSAQGNKLYYTQTNGWQSHVNIKGNQHKTWTYTKHNNEAEHIYTDSSYKQSDKETGECNMEQTEETHSPQEITKPMMTTKLDKLVVSWSVVNRNNNVESWSDFGKNINRFNQAYIEEVCTNEGEGSGEFNMEQTEETHSPQNTTITEQRESTNKTRHL